jgi:hypothetical protein
MIHNGEETILKNSSNIVSMFYKDIGGVNLLNPGVSPR